MSYEIVKSLKIRQDGDGWWAYICSHSNNVTPVWYQNWTYIRGLDGEFKTEEALDEKLKGKMCIDAIVAVVNNKNNVSKVSAANLRDIYTGAITKWDEVK